MATTNSILNMEERARNLVDTFYKIQFTVYKCLGLFDLPDRYSRRSQLAFKMYFWHVAIFWIALFDLSMWTQIITNIADMNEVIKVFYICSTAIPVMAKFVTIRMKRKTYLALFALMHTADYLPSTPHELKRFVGALQVSRHVRNVYMSISLTALTCMHVTPLIADYSVLPLPIYIPINVDKIWRFVIVYTYEVLAISLCCFQNIAFDSLAASFFIYIKGQLNMLSIRLQNIGTNLEDSQQLINHQLKDCVRYYADILKMIEIMERLTSIPMTIQIICSVLVLVANFYAMTFLTDPSDYVTFSKYLMYQLCMLTQIFILCYFANEVTLKSMELSYALYSSNWIHCDKVNRKLMLVMMAQFDIPIRIKTINRCYSFNLAAFTSTVNSSYSYFALLKNMNS